MSKTHDIIGIGSALVDSLAHVSDEFIASIDGEKGGMELVDSTQINQLMAKVEQELIEAPGGSAGNTIFALSHLGLKTTFLGKIGNCQGARFFKDAYSRMGGNHSRLKIGEIPNGRCLSLITPDSERTMRTDLGAAMTLTPDEVSEADFAGCRHAHIEGYLLFNRELMQKVITCAKAAGCTVSIDLASFEVVHASKDILSQLLTDYVDIVFANEDEASAYTGNKDEHDANAKELAKLCNIAVVKLGKNGSLICQGDSISRIDPIVIDQPLDTTAAGDFWAAGFLYGWLKDHSIESAGNYGSLLGSEVVQVMGSILKDETWNNIRTKITRN